MTAELHKKIADFAESIGYETYSIIENIDSAATIIGANPFFGEIDIKIKPKQEISSKKTKKSFIASMTKVTNK